MIVGNDTRAGEDNGAESEAVVDPSWSRWVEGFPFAEKCGQVFLDRDIRFKCLPPYAKGGVRWGTRFAFGAIVLD